MQAIISDDNLVEPTDLPLWSNYENAKIELESLPHSNSFDRRRTPAGTRSYLIFNSTFFLRSLISSRDLISSRASLALV